MNYIILISLFHEVGMKVRLKFFNLFHHYIFNNIININIIE